MFWLLNRSSSRSDSIAGDVMADLGPYAGSGSASEPSVVSSLVDPFGDEVERPLSTHFYPAAIGAFDVFAE